MFNALSSLGNRRQIITNEEATLLHDRHTTLRAARQYTTARCAIMSATTNMRGITQDLTDLRRLSHVINRYGINRPLIEFAGSVKKIVSCVPSNENLDVVTADGSDPRTINTIDGIDQYLDTEPTMVADWVRTSSDNIKSLLVSTTDQIHGFAEAISYYLTVLENNTVDSETLSNTTITAVAYSDAIGCIQALLDILPDLDAAVSDPTDNDAIAAHKTKMADIVAKIGDHTGLAVDPEDEHQVIFGNQPTGSTPNTATFSSLGYTVGNVINLLKRADNLVDEVNGLIERKETITGNLDATIGVLCVIDNDVPPAISSINDSNESYGVDSDRTQADIIHAHVSSHLCCISAIVDASISAVQNVLVVAECATTVGGNSAD